MASRVQAMAIIDQTDILMVQICMGLELVGSTYTEHKLPCGIVRLPNVAVPSTACSRACFERCKC